MRILPIAIALITLPACSCNGGGDKKSEGPITLADIDQRILDDPSNAALFAKRAMYHEQLDSNVAAMNDWRRAIALDSTNSTYYVALGDLFYRKVRLDDAEQYLTKAFQVDPTDTEARLKLAEMKLVVREYRRAMELANDALRIDPLNAQGYYLKGWIHMEMGDTSLSISSFRTAIEQDPYFYSAFVQLGVLHAAQGERLALDYYNSAIEIMPASVEALYGKGMFAQEHGMDSVALDCYAMIKEVDPRNPLPWYNTGYILLEHQRDLPAAREQFSEAIARMPIYPQAYYNRGLTYELQGILDSASVEYRMALALEPDMTLAAEGLSRLQQRGLRIQR
jgi:tetratricopeptide (TPR) repeat protein